MDAHVWVWLISWASKTGITFTALEKCCHYVSVSDILTSLPAIQASIPYLQSRFIPIFQYPI